MIEALGIIIDRRSKERHKKKAGKQVPVPIIFFNYRCIMNANSVLSRHIMKYKYNILIDNVILLM